MLRESARTGKTGNDSPKATSLVGVPVRWQGFKNRYIDQIFPSSLKQLTDLQAAN